MKYMIMAQAIFTGALSVAGLFWLLRKVWRMLLALFIVGWISGCSSVSNHFDKSPCACDFKPLNTSQMREAARG